MELREVEIFLTLADELHFGRTAERLGVTGARVSQTIKKLERQIGAPLFDRTSRRVELTAIGRTLHDEWRPAFDRLHAGFERAVAASRGVQGVLRVGFSSPLVAELIMRIADAFRTRHPECEVEIREVHISHLLEPLRNGELDLQVCESPVDEPDLVQGGVLLRDPRFLAVSSRHRIAGRESVTMEDLAGETVIGPAGAPDYLLDRYVPARTPSGRPLERHNVVTSRQELLALVGASRGVAVVGAQGTRYHQRPDIVYVPFSDAPPIEYGIVWPAAGATRRLREFVRLAQSIAAEDAAGRE